MAELPKIRSKPEFHCEIAVWTFENNRIASIMRRAQVFKPNEPLVFSETEIPDAPDGGIVVKTKFSGICGSDAMQWGDSLVMSEGVSINLSDFFYKFPITLGHEISGIVHSIGKNQPKESSHSVGDRVIVYACRGCNECGYCAQDMPNRCKRRLGGNYGLSTPGGYATFVSVVDSREALKLPDAIPLEVGCMLGCAGLTSYSALDSVKSSLENIIKVEGGTSLLITATGGVSAWCFQIARAFLPKDTKIVVSSTSEERLAHFCEIHGCDDRVLWKDDANEKDLIALTKEKGWNGGFDAVLDMVGNPRSTNIAYNSLRPNGTLVLVGLRGGAASYPVPDISLWSKEVKGSLMGSRKQLKSLVKLVADSKMTIPPLRYFTLEEVNEALVLLKQGKIEGRAIIQFD